LILVLGGNKLRSKLCREERSQQKGLARKQHNISCEVNPKHLPLVGNKRGGPDLLIWRDNTWFTIDVCVSQHLQASYHRKQEQYQAFAKLTNSIIVPAVLSPNGQFHKDTWQHFLKIATGTRGFITDFNTNSITALYQGQFNGVSRLKSRQFASAPDASARLRRRHSSGPLTI